ncbi:hypothetical protein EBR43_06655 [bacterium]|nr:hypothetical protein [bacterium]
MLRCEQQLQFLFFLYKKGLGSSPNFGINHKLFSIMSLLSKSDRDLTIEAIDFYLENKGRDLGESKVSILLALRNWVKIENTKYE